MSTIIAEESEYFERLFDMKGGTVLDYSNRTFGNFFNGYGIDIHSEKYQTIGTSKANKLRAFWEQDPDALVGRVLLGLLDSYESVCELNKEEPVVFTLKKSREVADRLSGNFLSKDEKKDADEFLAREFTMPSIDILPIDPKIIPIIKSRIDEAKIGLKFGAHLSVILLCGSTLEGILLGAARKQCALFNRAKSCPRHKDGKVKHFHEWTLSESINVACEVGLLKEDAKNFSHDLRDFRNYIHPYQQAKCNFTPDEHNAKICLQVLKMALASVAGER